MSFLLAAAAICASGYALLRAIGLATGRPSVDLPLSWFVGSAWVGMASFTARGLLGIPSGPATAIVVLALPVAGWAVARRGGGWPGPWGAGGDGGGGSAADRAGARWLPRPAWLFAPMAAWTAAVAVTVLLHGLATPVHTDDSYRVRALAPILAATGAWNDAARDAIAVAGPVPTYVPSLAWVLGAGIDPVHVSASVVLTFLALLALLVALGSERGVPEAGWGAAFAITSMPFFDYHAASTYADAWLGMFLAAAFAFLIAYGKKGAPADAGRTMLLVVGAALVKREGELLVLPVAAVLLAQVAWRGRTARGTLGRIGAILGAYLLPVAARVAAVGPASAFPFLRAAAERSVAAAPAVSATAPGAVAPGGPGAAAILLRAVFTDGDLGILWWVVLASLLLLAPRLRREGLLWALLALGLVLAETAASALWLYPEFTLNRGTVHRSLLPVSAAAAVFLAWLLGSPITPPVRPEAATRKRSRKAPRRRGG
jgi:hypothetical protein